MFLKKLRDSLFCTVLIIFPLILSAQDSTLSNFSAQQKQKLVFDGKRLAEVPDTKVKLIPPANFILYDKIKGFIHAGSSSTIQVTEVENIPYVLLIKDFSPEYFAKQGFKYISEEDVTTANGKKGKLFIVTFTTKNVEYERLVFFTGTYNKTIWLNANYPLSTKFLFFEVMKASLLSVTFE